ncbi:hypothetical protein V2J09_021973 [Rumex salicifolius]
MTAGGVTRTGRSSEIGWPTAPSGSGATPWEAAAASTTYNPRDDPVNPKPGTLRHAVIQYEPLWIVFKRDMVISLKQELIMNSFKTIDGRGVNVHIAAASPSRTSSTSSSMTSASTTASPPERAGEEHPYPPRTEGHG